MSQLHSVVMVIQIISIVVVFIECWVAFRNWRSKAQAYLFFACITTLVNDAAYLMEMTSRNKEQAFTSLQMSYLGKTWTGFFMLLFIAELTGFTIPRVVKVILGIINTATYIAVFTTKTTGLYYQSTLFALNGDLVVLTKKPGIWHHFWTGMMVFYTLFGIVMLIITLTREKSAIVKKRVWLVLLSLIIQGGCVVIQMLRLFPICDYYDLTMASFPIGGILVLVAIFKYRLFDAEGLARKYVDDELSEGIIAIDNSGRVGFSNATARELFPKLTINPRKTTDKIDQAIETDNLLYLNDRIYTPSSQELIQKGQSVGRLYVLKDDTEHYNYMAELSEQKQIADDANKAKSLFLASMSHEIRTPINAVLGMDEMILRESREPDTLSYAGDIRTAGQTLLSLINDILDFSKIEEGRMEILPTQYELSSMINDLVNMIRSRAEKKDLQFEVEVDQDIPCTLYGDEIRIKQVVLNLLTNAVKYTEKGSVKLEVGYRRADSGQIILSFRVTDTGIGMKEEDMNRLFSPFERIEEVRNRSVEGTGLGMSIVKQLLELMDSQLDVNSVYGEGSEFSFELRQGVVNDEPIGDYSARYEAAANEVYHELFHAPSARILVVDDNETNLAVIKNLLKRTQIQIDTATSGREAIGLAAAKLSESAKSSEQPDSSQSDESAEQTGTNHRGYDIILIDHMMPDMDGIETLQHLKKQAVESEISGLAESYDHTSKRTTNDLPDQTVYIALTANAVSGAREMYLSAGFDDYLTKPVDGSVLETTLRRYLPAEKVLPADGADVSAGEDSLPDWLTRIPELDMTEGLRYGATPDGYISILKVFHRTAEQKMQEIRDNYENENIGDYTIEVHALKSSARMIGATEISALAKQLEDAGKSGDMDFIHDNTDRLLTMYRELDEKLIPLDEKKLAEDISDKRLDEAFRTIGEIAESMDYGLMEELLDSLRGYRMSSDDEERLTEISSALTQLDWDAIMDIVKERK